MCVSSSLFLKISDSLEGGYFKRVSLSPRYISASLSHSLIIHSKDINWQPTLHHSLDLENMTVNKTAKNYFPLWNVSSSIFLTSHFCLSRCLPMMTLISTSQEDSNVLINCHLMCGASPFSSTLWGCPTSNHLLKSINVADRSFEAPWDFPIQRLSAKLKL